MKFELLTSPIFTYEDCNQIPQGEDIAKVSGNIEGVDVDIFYGTTDYFEVKDKDGNEFYSYEDLIKTYPEYNCVDWVDKFEADGGFIEETPNFCFVYDFNGYTISVEHLDNCYYFEDEIKEDLTNEFLYIVKNNGIDGISLDDYKDEKER